MSSTKIQNWPEPLRYAGVNELRWHGRVLTHFSGCDYFRLARDPRLAAAAAKTQADTGLSVSASRLTTGNRKIYLQLEAALAAFFRADTALLVADGYLAPLAAAQALASEVTHAFIDESSHMAPQDAARMLDCPVKKFPHGDVAALRQLLARCGRDARPVIVTDGFFTFNGSAAPLREYLKILPHTGLILVDDAHGGGVLGRTGKGTLEHEHVGRERIIQCGTLSKAFGAFGGFVLCSRALRKKMMRHSGSLVGATPLPPPLAGAALTGVKILARDSARRKRLFANTAWLRQSLRAAGWSIAEAPGPVVCLPELPDRQTGRLKRALISAGIYPPYVKYGTPPRSTFRFVISSEHTRAELKKLADTLARFISASR